MKSNRLLLCSRNRIILVIVVLSSFEGVSTGVNAQFFWDVIFPCPTPKACNDPCQPCSGGGVTGTGGTTPTGCDISPTTIRTGLFGWKLCPGCPALDKCWDNPPNNDEAGDMELSTCCDLTTKPSLVECESSTGCTCCSDGGWVVVLERNNDGSSRSAEIVCRGLNLQPGKECQYYACTKDLSPCPDGSSVGRDFTDPECPFRPCRGE